MGSTKVPTTNSLPCEIPAADWEGIITLRPNVLLNGPQPATNAVLDALKPHLRRPHSHCVPEAHRALPLQTGTLILHEIGALNTRQQEQLLQWFSHLSEPTQVVSTSSSSLYALVQDGTFSADLFYRVNVVVVDC
jgi:Sigma-54 interaction domain